MGWKSVLIKPFAKHIARRIAELSRTGVAAQEGVFRNLILRGAKTAFGHDHDFKNIRTYEDFKARVPIRDYEDLKEYIERVKYGEADILWPGKPTYFAKTSGTTSGVKYIPITRDSIPNHFGSARNALFNYYAETGKGKWLDGKVIFLSGSPELDEVNGIKTGRLSGISNHLIPNWLKANQMPTYETNCIDAWEDKVDAIVQETVHQNMTLISGIPPWVQMYYERLLEVTGKKTVSEIFPNYSVFVYGGVNFEPYRAKLEELVGKRLDGVETYPASEGFIAFQDSQTERGLWLNVDSGIFFEFIPVNEYGTENATRLSLRDVELGVNYALIINNNAGLWGYSIGDTVEFVSKNPYRLIVTGRIKHFISAFGEHVIGKEVEEALLFVANTYGTSRDNREGVRIVEFHVAPQVIPLDGGLPYHEWFIEFDNLPHDMIEFERKVDAAMMLQNIYYNDLIMGHILRPLVIRPLRRDAFRDYMKSEGKLGGQNKVPRLANDRQIAVKLEPYR
jgi:GH3 auxin-responsive promoter